MYLDVSTIIINKLKINCYKLFETKIYSMLNLRSKNKQKIEISLLNFIVYQNNLVKNYQKNKKNNKHFNLFLILYKLGKLLSFKLLALNREEVMLLLTSGAFSTLQKYVSKKLKKIKKSKKQK